MDLQAMKLSVMQKLMMVDKEALLSKVNDLLEKEMIVGYTVDGEPLTKEQYDARLRKAEEDLLEGRVTSSDELRKEVKSWQK